MAMAPTWAQVVRKRKPPAFLPTECAVDLEQFAAPQRLPSTSSFHSAFLPLPSTYKQSWAADIVNALPLSASGFVPRADIFLLEVCFASKEAQQDFINTPFTCKHFMAHPVPPTGTPPTYIPIKMINVPVLALVVVEQLRSFWSQHGDVVAIAPHKYKGTPFLSNCWDLVLKLPAGKSLSATPFFDISGFKVMASWPGSDKACPRCKQVGHDSQSCPQHPASKTSKKRSSSSTKQPASTLPSSSTAVVSPVTADATADKDSPASDLSLPIDDSSMEISTDSDALPFDLSPE